MINAALIQESLPHLLRGSLITLQIAFCAGIIGLLGGTLLGFIQTGHKSFWQLLANIYVTVIRGIPMLIQISFMFFLLPYIGINLPAIYIAIIAIGLNSCAYISQVIRSGIQSVSKGQIEAARVLGLSTHQINRYIIFPQAIRSVLPAIGNEFITLTKDSSLASTIGVMELFKEGRLIIMGTYDPISIYVAIGLLYLLMTTTLSCAVDYIERKMNIHA